MKRIPSTGIVGLVALREAASTEYGQVMRLVHDALRDRYGAQVWFDIEAMFSDRVIVCKDGRYWKYGYALNDKNIVALADPVEVTEEFPEVSPMREALAAGDWFVEATQDGKAWDVIALRAGVSQNGVFYSDAVLREAAPLFEGAKVYVKSNDEHLKGSRPDIHKLAGWLSGAKFVEGKGSDAGHIAARMNLSGAAELRETIVDAWKRGKKDLVGLSIDAIGKAVAASGQRLREGAKRIAQSISKVLSVDLIVDPSAGGALVRLVEAADSKEHDPMKDLMLAKIKAKFPNLDVASLATDDAILAKFQEAIKDDPKDGTQVGPAMTREEFQAELRMVEARAAMRAQINATTLPAPSKAALVARFEKLARFTEADVDAEIKAERDYVVRLIESQGGDAGKVKLTEAGDIQVEDRSVKIAEMLDAFFDPAHKNHASVRSFKECYIEITGDKRITGRIENVNRSRLAEAVGAAFRESIDTAGLTNVLGSALRRAMIREFRAAVEYDAWRKIVDVVPLADFRTKNAVNYGGYGDLPVVNQGSAYLALGSPTDAAATYTPAKRGGTEDVTLEAIKNDDVGLIQRIPRKLGRSARRTLAKFVFDFLRTNPTIYDSVAFFHASHGNLGSTAFSATEYGVVRTAMMKQAERDSNDRIGIGPSMILCPVDLEAAVWTAFQRSTNNDKDFIQTLAPMIIPVWYWTDATDWVAAANPLDIPGIEIGFLDGREEPELFVQDNPTVGSMFSNDKLTWKIRHIYGGAVVPDGYKAFYKEVVAG